MLELDELIPDKAYKCGYLQALADAGKEIKDYMKIVIDRGGRLRSGRRRGPAAESPRRSERR